MNRWLAATLLLIFLFLATFSILFGKKIHTLEVGQSIIPSQAQSVTSHPSVTEEKPKLSVVAQNLEIPWGIAFLPDRSMLITERPGRVRFVSATGVLRQDPVATLSEVNQIGEGGLLGIAVHPKFETNKFVYVYYTYSNNNDNTLNRVVRYLFDGKDLADKKIIVDAIPGAANHDGGRIKFGPDGFLYIATGDSQEPSLSQSTISLAGKILRVTDAGQPVSGNPFNTTVYSYGHRNPQGLTWDDKGQLWSTEHGRSGIQSGLDELNVIEPGKNYGWQVIEGDEKKAGMVTPMLNSGSTTWAPSGAAFYQGSIFFGGLRGQGLYEAVIGEQVSLKKHFDRELGRIRDVVLGPDNLLYITTSNRDGRGIPKENDDRIYRVNPQKF